MRHWAHRVVLAYLGIYGATGALGGIIGLEAPVGFVELAQRGVVTAIGRWFAVDFDFTPSGSGDTAYHYASAAFDVVLALIVATIWHAAARARPVSPRTQDVATVGVRYTLAAIMLGYGFIKVIPVQMPPPGPDRLLNSLGDTSPMGLLWTLMGASLPYQMFSGAGEAIGSLLLFWRRTTLLGALILTGVLTNVVALNLCYDVPVKLFSAHLLGMALFLVAPHVPRLLNVLWLNRPALPVVLEPYPIARRWLRWSALAVKAVVVVASVWMPIANAWEGAHTYGFLAPRREVDGIYRVTSFTRTDPTGGPATDASRWVRFGLNAAVGVGAVQLADGTTHRYRVQLDAAKHTLQIRSVGGGASTLAFALPRAGTMRMEGAFESAPIVVELTRQPDATTLLTGRGFRWISQFPFNR